MPDADDENSAVVDTDVVVDTDAVVDNGKDSPDTGADGIAVIAALCVTAAGTAVATRKRK